MYSFYEHFLIRKLHNLKTHFSFRFLHVYKLKMSYRIEQNDNDIFFILYEIWRLDFSTIKDRSAIYLVKKLFWGGVDYDIEHLQLNIGNKYLKTAKGIDESLILAIVLRNCSTKPSYILQLKRELKFWIYIFNLFHFYNHIKYNRQRKHLEIEYIFTLLKPMPKIFGTCVCQFIKV
jgi:hypothetical protein